MGMYAENNYNVKIPVAAIEAIITEWGSPGWQGPYEVNDKGLVHLVSDEFGNDSELPDYEVEDGNVHINGFSYGKLGSADEVAQLIARHGATGIVWGECDGMLFLVEFKDGVTRDHGGEVVFPTYTGDLYR